MQPSPTTPPPSARPQPEVVLEPAGGSPVRVRVEVARTEGQRRRGLMFRRHMDPDAGMLFWFDEPERQSFWMRNTFLPLDIVFIGAHRRIVGVVEDARPLTEDARAVEAESQYVLEVHAGFARSHGLTVGTPVRFVNLPED